MPKLSPKALRFIDAAMNETQDDTARAAWARFGRSAANELPAPLARAALTALEATELRMRKALASAALEEDEAADLSNDLGFVVAIESDLRRQLTPP
jgi:hypothetical protein